MLSISRASVMILVPLAGLLLAGISIASFDSRGRAVTMNFVLVNGPDGWVIYDVESPHDSLRAFLAQYRN
jgi:hypothetical protein